MESSGKAEAAGQTALTESTGTKGIGGGSKLNCLLNCKSSDGLDKRTAKQTKLAGVLHDSNNQRSCELRSVAAPWRGTRQHVLELP